MLAAAQGEDPSRKRKASRGAITIAQLADAFEKEGLGYLRETNRRATLARARNHIVPLLGKKKVSAVGIAEVEQLLRDVKAGKTVKDEKTGLRSRVIVRGGEAAAGRAVADLSAMFNFAKRRELVSQNPCLMVRKPAINKRTRFLNLDEMKRFGDALGALEASAAANAKAIAIMRLWALTGCRRDEIAGLKWSEVDFGRACLTLAETKTGRSIRPLAHAASAILTAQPRDVSSEDVFPSDDNTATYYQGTKRYWVRAVKLANLPGVTPHTLRHTI